MTLYANASSDPASRTNVGFALLQNGASSEAMQVFRAETLERPRDPETHRGLGQAFFASGQYVSARHEFERALRLHPGEQQATTALALTNSVIDMDPDLPGLSGAE